MPCVINLPIFYSFQNPQGEPQHATKWQRYIAMFYQRWRDVTALAWLGLLHRTPVQWNLVGSWSVEPSLEWKSGSATPGINNQCNQVYKDSNRVHGPGQQKVKGWKKYYILFYCVILVLVIVFFNYFSKYLVMFRVFLLCYQLNLACCMWDLKMTYLKLTAWIFI